MLFPSIHFMRLLTSLQFLWSYYSWESFHLLLNIQIHIYSYHSKYSNFLYGHTWFLTILKFEKILQLGTHNTLIILYNFYGHILFYCLFSLEVIIIFRTLHILLSLWSSLVPNFCLLLKKVFLLSSFHTCGLFEPMERGWF